VLDVATGASRQYPALMPGGAVFGVAWSASGDALVYSQAEARSPMVSRYRLVRLDLDSGTSTVLARTSWTLGALERLPDGRWIAEGRVGRAALFEVRLDGGPNQALHRLTDGSTFARQPVYSPDGERAVFTSPRGGDLDLWSVSTRDGAVRRLTDDPAIDWDPAFLPDGRLLFSSDRSGNFEIWLAEADGASPRQLTRDGFDAENATATNDGWVLYNSTRPDGQGVWRIRTDGSGAERIVEGATGLPEAAPDGDRLLYLVVLPAGGALIRIVSASGAVEPRELRAKLGDASPWMLVPGRARWLPDGRGIAFVTAGPDGRAGVWRSPTDSGGPLRPLSPVDLGDDVESFGISPDGRRATFSRVEFQEVLLEIEGLAID
jgi:Tol biopolymer transport system component